MLPPVEEFATEQLMETARPAGWLIWAALALTLAGGGLLRRGWLGAALGLLLLSTPLDLVATPSRDAAPAAASDRGMLSRRLPVAGRRARAARARLVGNAPRAGWGALIGRARRCAFAEAARIEKAGYPAGRESWLFSRRNAIFAAIPFALAGRGRLICRACSLYAAVSFFIVQHVRHSRAELTRS